MSISGFEDFQEWLDSIRENSNPDEEEKAHNNHACGGIISCSFCQAESFFNTQGYKVDDESSET